jgi:hypothetical protein
VIHGHGTHVDFPPICNCAYNGSNLRPCHCVWTASSIVIRAPARTSKTHLASDSGMDGLDGGISSTMSTAADNIFEDPRYKTKNRTTIVTKIKTPNRKCCHHVYLRLFLNDLHVEVNTFSSHLQKMGQKPIPRKQEEGTNRKIKKTDLPNRVYTISILSCLSCITANSLVPLNQVKRFPVCRGRKTSKNKWKGF